MSKKRKLTLDKKDLAFVITEEVLDAAILRALDKVLVNVIEQVVEDDEYQLGELIEQMVTDAIENRKIELEDLVRLTVSARAPTNENISKVIKDVQEHLDRYPSLVVGKAIGDYMMKRF